jgi:tetratricopeptide (TPR) repeat protein
LRLAAETEATIAQTASATDPELAEKRARALFGLAEIRRRLGDVQEAERLLVESADVNLALGSAVGAERAALSRLTLAGLAVKAEHYSEACAHIEQMIKLNDGFPRFEHTKQGPTKALQIWLLALEKTKNFSRLYDASTTALEMLDPTASPSHREVHSQALALHGKSADELGHQEEAVDFYERAISRLEEEEPSPDRDWLLNHAILRVPVLLGELDRDDEAADAVARLERLQGKHPLVKGTRTAARLWARWGK